MAEQNPGSLPPDIRIKNLRDFSNSFQVDFNTPAKRYYNSGELIIRTADMHFEAGEYNDAFIYYMKYIQLFVEKIIVHPDHKNVPPEDIAKTRQRLGEVMNRAEKLKEKLLKSFTAEHEKYVQERRKEDELLIQRRKEEDEREGVRNKEDVNVEFSGGVRKTTIDRDIVKPVPYLPNDFLVYEIPETKSYDSPTSPTSFTTKPGVDRSTKPTTYSPYNHSQYKSSLRTITIPSKMLDTFLQLAQKNTDNNIETCGVLAGKLCGSSDSCTTDNEEDLFMYQNKHDLITVGWIHTHPSQTAFLSSVDLHTHYSYQLMMSEAIAIVCAPRYSETRFFRLTPDYGLNFIANCRQKGFHPHPSDPPLFQVADHCEVLESAPIEMVDLRR